MLHNTDDNHDCDNDVGRDDYDNDRDSGCGGDYDNNCDVWDDCNNDGTDYHCHSEGSDDIVVMMMDGDALIICDNDNDDDCNNDGDD